MPPKYAKDQPHSFSNHIKNIAIVGATGSVGEYITHHLLANGKHTITAITRAESNSPMPAGVQVAKVNYDDESTLVGALRGQDALVITMKSGQHEAQGKLIEAAAKAGVEWVMPNEYGPDVIGDRGLGEETALGPPIWAAHEQIERLGVSSWIGLTCSYWYAFSLAIGPYAYGFDIQNKKVIFMDDGKTKTIASSWQQCGRAVASLFSFPILPQDENDRSPYLAMWRNKEVYISSFLVSQREMLDCVLRVTGGKESDWTIETQTAEERWREGRELMESGRDVMRGFQTAMYARVFFRGGGGDYSDKLDNGRLGLPEEDFDEETRAAIQMVERGYNYFARG